MPDDRAIVASMIGQVAGKDQNLANILTKLNTTLGKLIDIVEPIRSTIDGIGGPIAVPSLILAFFYELRPLSVHLFWESPDLVSRVFEIRRGSVWETADFVLRTPSLEADLNPILVGTTTYLIKGINASNVYAVEATSVDVIVPAIGPVVLSGTVIDNSVLLSWTIPTSAFNIDYYILSKQKGSDPYVEVGRLRNNFTSTFETAADTYTYKIVPVDIAGNLGVESTVIKDVRKPPDFELLVEFTSLLNGTLSNTIVYNDMAGTPILVACVNPTETWTEHFVNNGYTSPHDQIDAGYPYYPQPAPLTGYYEEVIDLGALISNVVVNLSWAQMQIAGSTTVSAQMSSSANGIDYNPVENGTSIFFSSIRYVKIRINFAGTNPSALLELSNLRGAVDVKKEVDSGEAQIYAVDADGTTIFFNKEFKDIDSLTCTAASIQPIEVVRSFDDVPNPVSFRALAYDSAGIRIDKVISWKARGIV